MKIITIKVEDKLICQMKLNDFYNRNNPFAVGVDKNKDKIIGWYFGGLVNPTFIITNKIEIEIKEVPE